MKYTPPFYLMILFFIVAGCLFSVRAYKKNEAARMMEQQKKKEELIDRNKALDLRMIHYSSHADPEGIGSANKNGKYFDPKIDNRSEMKKRFRELLKDTTPHRIGEHVVRFHIDEKGDILKMEITKGNDPVLIKFIETNFIDMEFTPAYLDNTKVPSFLFLQVRTK